MIEIVRSFDMDDTIIGREKITRSFSMLGDFRKRLTGNAYKIPDVLSFPSTHHFSVSTDKKSIRDSLALFFSSRRGLLPGVTEALIISSSDPTVMNILNTGRSSKDYWVNMNEQQLNGFGYMDIFEQKYFKPKGMTNIESKMDVISKWERHFKVEHYDDDPQTAVAIAASFPKQNIYLLRHGITMLAASKKELEKYPNLHQIDYLGQNFIT